MDHIVIQSAGTFSVAVICLMITVHQILLLVRKPTITWAGWSAAISFSGMTYAIGVFLEYNTPAGSLNRFAGVLEFAAILMVVHSAYGFSFAVLGRRGNRYHLWAGPFHGVVFLLLWTSDAIVSRRFVAHDFITMGRPYIEPGLGPLGPAFEAYCVLAAMGLILFLHRQKDAGLRNRPAILAGMGFWLALAVHDGLASMGLRTFQYLMEYGFLGFSFVILWVVFNGYEDLSTLEQLRTIGEFANDMIVIIQNGSVVFANPSTRTVFRWLDPNPSIEDFLETVVPEDRPKLMAHYRGLINGMDTPEFLMIHLRKPNGGEMIVDIRAKRVNYQFQPALLAFMRDATRRVREEEGNFSVFFESMEDMIAVAKPDGTILHTNTAARQKLNYRAHELEAMRIHDLFPKARQGQIASEVDAVLKNERKILQIPMVASTGKEIPVEMRIWQAMWNGAESLFAIAKDQTAEHDARELLNRLFRNNPALMALFSMPERRLTEVNNAFLETFQYHRNEIIGKTGTELGLFPDPVADEALSDAILAEGHLFNVERQARRKDASVFDCLFSAEIIRHRGRRLLLCVMIDISDRKRVERELRQARNTLEQRVLERTRDIQEMHEQMIMQEKMASIGQLAAGVAHELNNPINFVSTNFAGLKEHFTDLCEAIRVYRQVLAAGDNGNDDLHHGDIRAMEAQRQIDYILEDTPVLFEESRRGFDRIAKIIHSMRQFSHTDQQGRFSPFDINTAVENAVVIARNTYKHCARVHLDLGRLPEIACHPEQIHQVFLNLIVNSAQAIESQERKEPGNITVQTREEEGVVVCRVTDDGPGIPEGIREQVFEAFFTTKPAGKGSGLGLSLSYDIVVNKHGGTMAVDCPREGGTIFTFRIPGNLDSPNIS